MQKKSTFFFKKNIGFERSCFKILKCMWLQTGLLDLKNTKQMIFLFMVDFNAFLKVIHCSKCFEIFEIHQ